MKTNTYTCIECGFEFEHPAPYTETMGLDEPPFYDYDGCPKCGGAYAETHICDHCMEVLVPPYVRLWNGDELCDECCVTITDWGA